MSVFDTDARKHSVTTLLQIAVFVVTAISFFTSFVQPIHATDDECAASDVEGLAVSCQPYIDPANPAKIIPEAQYLKCLDTITCDADADGVVRKRCCVQPLKGSYGGECFLPQEIDRKSLGVETGTMTFANFKPKQCGKVDEDALSPADKNVYIVPPEIIRNPDGSETRRPQSLSDVFKKVGGRTEKPPKGKSIGGLPVYEESIQFENYAHRLDNKPTYKTYTYYYQIEDDNTKRYFITTGVINAGWAIGLHKLNGVEVDGGPVDPRPDQGGGPLKNLGCKLGNVFMTPLYNGVAALERRFTSQDNLPDVALLCAKGTPQFSDPGALTFNPDGSIDGLDRTDCHCIDTNSGPGTAAVLLCTRFIAGLDDVSAPWRILVPAPDDNNNGSTRFVGLLFGELQSTADIDEFRRKIDEDIEAFLGSSVDLGIWMDQLKHIGNQTLVSRLFLERFFGVDDARNIPPNTPATIDAFRQNRFVRQYVSCIACAKYGGFPSGLGCMPMDKVERFLAEGVLGFGITLAAAASIFCIIYGAIQFQLSAGESAKVQKAQKLITQCIVGLLIILFSVFILRFIGVNLLRIYGLG
ncbi:MAG TPA: hypothetical protein PKG71_02320 [Candidatus Woesebacteria bacterium]|nr:hypothetical protein [Candidatus Woesebacteria bacterium]HNS94780.1 hypothetical protein [Candidatus Woesebacteria bacterium]